MRYRNIGVIGAGAWGTALAQTAARAGAKVRLFCREPETVADIRALKVNRTFLPDITLSPAIHATGKMEELGECDLVLAVTPAQHLRSSLEAFRGAGSTRTPIVLCAKGIEQGTLKLMTQVAQDVCPRTTLAVLSGPSFAGEVAQGLPTAVTLACVDRDIGRAIAASVANPAFRPYLSTDLIGAEAGGAVKNVLAIACGAVEGLGLGRSAHSALITRGFAEMTRLGVALGAEAETLAGLCGLGDLVLTCSSPKSRNMSVGLALGRGVSLAEALANRLTVAEGVASAPAVRALAEKLGVDMPICTMTAAVLTGDITLKAAIEDLLARPLKFEH